MPREFLGSLANALRAGSDGQESIPACLLSVVKANRRGTDEIASSDFPDPTPSYHLGEMGGSSRISAVPKCLSRLEFVLAGPALAFSRTANPPRAPNARPSVSPTLGTSPHPCWLQPSRPCPHCPPQRSCPMPKSLTGPTSAGLSAFLMQMSQSQMMHFSGTGSFLWTWDWEWHIPPLQSASLNSKWMIRQALVVDRNYRHSSRKDYSSDSSPTC